MINKVVLIGNLGADPEIKYSKSGDAVASFSLATSESWKKEDGTKEERVEWHRIVAFKRLAEVCGQYLRKGSRAYIEGKLQTQKWQDKEGIDRWTTDVVARDMKMLSAKRAEEPPPSDPPS